MILNCKYVLLLYEPMKKQKRSSLYLLIVHVVNDGLKIKILLIVITGYHKYNNNSLHDIYQCSVLYRLPVLPHLPIMFMRLSTLYAMPVEPRKLKQNPLSKW